MTFQTEFPDYPASDMPAFPPGFEDTSWHNNSAPSIANPKIGISIWIDYAAKEMREYDGCRFLVNRIDSDGAFLSDDADLETDDWAEVLKFIEAAQ